MILEVFDALIQPAMSYFEYLEHGINTATPAGILLLGLLTGLRHSIGADHVAAVSTIVATTSTTTKRKIWHASLLGALWGVGHTASLLIAGLAVLLLAVNIPERIRATLEFGVGIMLVFLSVTALTGPYTGRFFRDLFQCRHEHTHDHLHVHQRDYQDQKKETCSDMYYNSHAHEHNKKDPSHQHGHKSLVVGMIHGMAGSGALMLVVLSTIHSIPLAIAFIAIFGAGSISSMIGISTAIGLPFAKMKHSSKLSLMLKYTSALTTLVIGAGLIYEIGITEQILSS